MRRLFFLLSLVAPAVLADDLTVTHQPPAGDRLRLGERESGARRLARDGTGDRLARGHTQLGEYDIAVGSGDTCGVTGPVILEAKMTDNGMTLSWVGVDGATSYRVMAAPDGGAPGLVIATGKTSATVRLAGSVYWWIEADRAGCPSVRSSTSHLVVVPTRRPRSQLGPSPRARGEGAAKPRMRDATPASRGEGPN